MSKKAAVMYVLLVVIVILFAAAYLIKTQPWKKETPRTSVFISELQESDISKIEIINKGQLLTLSKEKAEAGDIWYEQKGNEEKKEADATLIEAMFTKVKDLNVEQPVTESPDKQALFQVDTAGLQVKMYAGDQVKINFYIGKFTPDYIGVYIRKDGENKIYKTSEIITPVFNKSSFAKKADTNQ